ncbi:MAG TPA: phosphopantetheine-binding protein, partial [Longimicrobium sp.]
LLPASRVGTADDFFALGGHSLLLMRLVARVQAEFGVDLSIRAVFAHPTLQSLAAEVERAIIDDVLAMSEADARQLAELSPTLGG